MNESQASSLAARRPPAGGAVLATLALAAALAGCGQKGPLYLPEQDGAAGQPASARSAAADGHPAVRLAPVAGASSPGLPAAAR